jgi:hypothetical protein
LVQNKLTYLWKLADKKVPKILKKTQIVYFSQKHTEKGAGIAYFYKKKHVLSGI